MTKFLNNISLVGLTWHIHFRGGAEEGDGGHERGDEGEGHGEGAHAPARHQELLRILLAAPPEVSPDNSWYEEHGGKDDIVDDAKLGDELLFAEQVVSDGVGCWDKVAQENRLHDGALANGLFPPSLEAPVGWPLPF